MVHEGEEMGMLCRTEKDMVRVMSVSGLWTGVELRI